MLTIDQSHDPSAAAPMVACRVCGCTDDDCSRCVERTGEPCSWVEPDLCSACDRTGDKPEIDDDSDDEPSFDQAEDAGVTDCDAWAFDHQPIDGGRS